MTKTSWQFDSHSAIPLHLQLETHIKLRISNAVWQPGDRIPSERELVELTGLSRATIRQALMSLVHQHVLDRVHGSGTFVARPKYEQTLGSAYSFFEQFRQIGQNLQDTVIKQAVEHADTALAERLKIPAGTDIIVIERVRALQSRKMMLSTAFIPFALCPGLATRPITGSLYRLLLDDYHLTVTHGIDKLEAICATRPLAMRLDISRGAPLLFVDRTAYTTENRVLHVGENYIRSDMCRFSIDLQAGSALELKNIAT